MAGEPPDSPERRIDPNTASSSFSGVGSVLVGGGVYTGALIAARFVLTAAHVVPEPAAPMQFQLNTGGAARPIEVIRGVRHPSFVTVSAQTIGSDLAILELAADAPAVARRYRIYAGPVAPGLLVQLAGYGASGRGSQGPTVAANPSVKRYGANVIDQVIVDAATQAPAGFTFTFDPPPEGRPTQPKSLGNLVETGVAPGDSGCPAFIGSRSTIQLLGVCSFAARRNQDGGQVHTYGSITGGTIVGRHAQWIAETMRRPGATGGNK